ncbi:MAG: gamma-glutamyl-gamma-aminobutyrate hydrolase family protein [Deltaproteobacteria bacterium]|nr:gamma-glutamyl-gamma-aminobutyrate hydrolase family protein [Deltaproteobacteria bacterium]
MRRHIAVIDPGVRVPELDCFNRMSRRSRLPTTYHLPALFGMDSLLRAEDGLAGVVVLGSGASVNDALPWQDALSAWLRPRLDGGTPFLGLCYGHQLGAHLLGGAVDYLSPDRQKLVGMREIRLHDNVLWGEAVAGRLMVSHRETVVRLPDRCRVVGTSPEVAVEAFAHETLPIWGFQAHPEATPAFARNNGVPFDEDPSVLAFGHALVDGFLDRVVALAGTG